MAKKSSKGNTSKFKKTEGQVFSKGKKTLSKGKNAITPIGKRGKSAVGRRSRKG